MYDYSDLLNPANPLSPFNPSNPANPIYQDLYGDDTDLEEHKNQGEENSVQTHQEIKLDHALTNFSVVVLKSMMGIMFLLLASIILFLLIKWIRRRS
ncbi:hypothetical protein [Clostridium perfringens]|uniref:hypothetical protein n=1 Tax=Clostridium perfringens TaxID=1502 RepID=UPI00112DB620|nr:hypothetical protein [Clostridium perfringens]TPF98655.1 hypothetical protein XA71_12635 [Clostridium perfringens A]